MLCPPPNPGPHCLLPVSVKLTPRDLGQDLSQVCPFHRAFGPQGSSSICPGSALSTGHLILRAHPRRSLSLASFPAEARHVPLQALTAQAHGAPAGARRARSRKSCREPTLRGTRGCDSVWPGALLSPGQPVLIPHTVATGLPWCLLPPGWSRRIMSPGDQGSRLTSGSSDSTPWTPNSTGAKRCVHTGICPGCSYQPVHADGKWKPSTGPSTHGRITRGPGSQWNEVPTQAAAWRSPGAGSQTGLRIG